MSERPDGSVADLLVAWAIRIAAGDGQTPDELQRDLGVDGDLVTYYGDQALQQPPDGLREVRLRGGVRSMASVEVWPVEGSVTIGDLDDRFGNHQELPRVHWDSPHLLAYDVRSEHPAGRCTVFAKTSDPPGPDVRVDSVLLRTEPK